MLPAKCILVVGRHVICHRDDGDNELEEYAISDSSSCSSSDTTCACSGSVIGTGLVITSKFKCSFFGSDALVSKIFCHNNYFTLYVCKIKIKDSLIDNR